MAIGMENDGMEFESAKLMVLGVGGAGNNAVDRMVNCGITGVEFVAVNTDIRVLEKSVAPNKIQIGIKNTKGLGAGARPEVGKKAAEENMDDIKDMIKGHDLVFITAGMGGGTGTGAAPVIAKCAKEMGILTVAIVTKPFRFEGKSRMTRAIEGIEQLRENVDTLIIVSNQKLVETLGNVDAMEAFAAADDILRQGVQCISDTITQTGYINIDFSDVVTILQQKGLGHMGIGIASGEKRAEKAVLQAVTSPLLETSIKGSTGIILNIFGKNVRLQEPEEAADAIADFLDDDVEIITGITPTDDEDLGDSIRVTVIATGVSENVPEPENDRRLEKKRNETVARNERIDRNERAERAERAERMDRMDRSEASYSRENDRYGYSNRDYDVDEYSRPTNSSAKRITRASVTAEDFDDEEMDNYSDSRNGRRGTSLDLPTFMRNNNR